MTRKEQIGIAKELLGMTRNLVAKEDRVRSIVKTEGKEMGNARTASEEIPFGDEKFLLDNGFEKTEDPDRRVTVYRRDSIIVTVVTGRYGSHAMASRIKGGPVIEHYGNVRDSFRQLYREAFMNWKESHRPYPNHLLILDELCGKLGMNVKEDTIRTMEYELKNRMH